MKSGDKLQLSAAWWKKNKAITAPDGGLEKLLKTYESEAKVYLANPSVDGYAKTLEALKKVEQAAKSVADQCKSVVNRSTREALEKNEVIGQTRKELQGKQDDYAKRLKHFTEGGEALAKKIELAVQRLAELLSSAKQVASQGEGDRDAKEIEELQQSADKVYGELEEDLHELQQIAKTGTGLHPQDASAASSRIGAALKAGIKAVGDVKKLLADLPKLLPEEHRVARFQLTARWWRDNRGATPDGGLEDALKEYEVWLKKVAGAATTQNYPQLLHALDEVESTAKAVLAKLGNAQGELATALRGAPAVIKSARDPIDKAHRAYVEKVAAYTRKQADYLKFMQTLDRKTQAFQNKLTEAEKLTVGKKLPVVEKILAPLVRELKQLDTLRRDADKQLEDSDDGVHEQDTDIGRQAYRQAKALERNIEPVLRKARESLEKDFTYASGTPEVARGNKSTGEKPMNTGKKEQPPLTVRMTPAKLDLTPGKPAVLKVQLTRRDDFQTPVRVRMGDALPTGVTLEGALPTNLGPNDTNFEIKFKVGPELRDGLKQMLFSFQATDGSYQTQQLIPAVKKG